MWRFFETGEIGSLENELEGTIFRFYPQLQEIKRFFQTQGAELSLVTGSGSAVYGLFRDRDAADRCLAGGGRDAPMPPAGDRDPGARLAGYRGWGVAKW